MSSHNGNATSHHLLDSQFDDLKAKIHRLMDGFETHDDSRVRGYARSATEIVKTHPIAAATIAFGIGYILLRALRR